MGGVYGRLFIFLLPEMVLMLKGDRERTRGFTGSWNLDTGAILGETLTFLYVYAGITYKA